MCIQTCIYTHAHYRICIHTYISTWCRWYSYVSTLRGLRGLSKWVIELIRVISTLVEVITQHITIYSH